MCRRFSDKFFKLYLYRDRDNVFVNIYSTLAFMVSQKTASKGYRDSYSICSICNINVTSTLQMSYPNVAKRKLKLKHYQLSHPDQIFRCIAPSCEKEFAYASRMQLHYRRFHLNLKIPCNYCLKKSFSSKVVLRKHVEEEHSEHFANDLTYYCQHPGCNAKYASQTSLTLHRGKQKKKRKSKRNVRFVVNLFLG